MNMDQPNEDQPEISPPDSSQTPGESDAPTTPEEQMARFEEALKEEDWGHQPC